MENLGRKRCDFFREQPAEYTRRFRRSAVRQTVIGFLVAASIRVFDLYTQGVINLPGWSGYGTIFTLIPAVIIAIMGFPEYVPHRPKIPFGVRIHDMFMHGKPDSVIWAPVKDFDIFISELFAAALGEFFLFVALVAMALGFEAGVLLGIPVFNLLGVESDVTWAFFIPAALFVSLFIPLGLLWVGGELVIGILSIKMPYFGARGLGAFLMILVATAVYIAGWAPLVVLINKWRQDDHNPMLGFEWTYAGLIYFLSLLIIFALMWIGTIEVGRARRQR